MSTPENIRYHAAGHIAAASLLVENGQPTAAKLILKSVMQYATHPQVSAPPQLIGLLSDACEDPVANLISIHTLEEWFVHPLNTIIESSGSALTT